MPDHTDNALRAAVKALTQVVAPAVDPEDPLANEQLRLVSGYLEFLRTRREYLHDRDLFEFHHAVRLGRELVPMATTAGLATDDLGRAIEAADAVRRSSELASATAAVTHATSMLVRAATTAEESARQRIERLVLDASTELLEVDRAWFLPQGFDPEPAAVAGVEEALRGDSASPAPELARRTTATRADKETTT